MFWFFQNTVFDYALVTSNENLSAFFKNQFENFKCERNFVYTKYLNILFYISFSIVREIALKNSFRCCFHFITLNLRMSSHQGRIQQLTPKCLNLNLIYCPTKPKRLEYKLLDFILQNVYILISSARFLLKSTFSQRHISNIQRKIPLTQ